MAIASRTDHDISRSPSERRRALSCTRRRTGARPTPSSSRYPRLLSRGIRRDVNTAPLVSLTVALASAVGCMSTRGGGGEITAPVVTVSPDEFVLRDLRREAAQQLACQSPMVDVHMAAWAGS